MFPTFLYATGAGVRIISRIGKKEEDRKPSDIAAARRDFTMNLLSESLILNLLNGFIIIFGVGQLDFGIVVSIAGVMVSLFGISSEFTETQTVRELFLAISSILVLGELLDFASYSYIVSAGLMVGLFALLFYYAFRISGEFDIATA